MGSLLFLLGALLGIAQTAHSATLSAKDFKQMQETIQDAKAIIGSISVDTEYARNLELGILSAYAFDEAFDCFYAGWPSQLKTSGAKRVCTRPTETNRTDYKQGKCDQNTQMACNPVLFGDGLCAAVGATAFSQCENQFNSPTSKKYDYLKDLAKDKNKWGDLVQTLNMAKDVCEVGEKDGKVFGTQKGTAMCSRFLAKMKAMGPKMAALAPANNQANLTNQDIKKADKGNANNVTTAGVTGTTGTTGATGVTGATGSTAPSGSCCNVPGANNGAVHSGRSNIENIVNKASGGNSWLDPSVDPKALYKELKDKYLGSEKCHPYGLLPASEQKAYFLKMFSADLQSFRSNIVEKKPADDAASLNEIMDGMKWDKNSQKRKDWLARLGALPKKYSDQESLFKDKSRADFQRDLIKEMSTNYDEGPLKETAKKVSDDYIKQLKLPDCDFPSEDAFVSGVNDVRKSKLKFAKEDIFTLVDRSMPKDGRRVITFDMKNKDVLFHSNAFFGDANPSTLTSEKAVCSNSSTSNASPYGVAKTMGSHAASNGSFQRGTYIQSYGADGKPLALRGIAFHESGTSDFGGYYKTKDYSTTGENLDKVLNGDDQDALNGFINRAAIDHGAEGMTDGCIGIPAQSVRGFQDIVENGSAVYFSCPCGIKLPRMPASECPGN